MSEKLSIQDSTRWDQSAGPYDAATRGFTAKYARDALDLASIASGMEVLDVAAGTGALSLEAARQGAEVLATDFSIGMLRVLGSRARAEGLSNLRIAVMDGQALDLEDEAFDRAFSMFGLMLFPDLAAGFRELHRVVRPRGRAVVGVWTEARNELIQLFGEALQRGVPTHSAAATGPAGAAEVPWAAIATPEGLTAAMSTAGFDAVRVFTVRHLWTFESPSWLWSHLPRMSPGTANVFESLDDGKTAALEAAFHEVFRERLGRGPFALAGDAHLGVGFRV
ncbi:MAG: class I SAM-dependent methyltransferase [Myxococcota bacterium]